MRTKDLGPGLDNLIFTDDAPQVCVSYAFMLPVATGPNAICYGASSLKTTEMMRTGVMMNIICILTTW